MGDERTIEDEVQAEADNEAGEAKAADNGFRTRNSSMQKCSA